MTAFLPGLPDLPALRATIANTLLPAGLLGTYTFADGSTDPAIAVEGLGTEAGEDAYPPANTRVTGLEVVIVPAEDIPIESTLDGYIQTYRHVVVLKQWSTGENLTLKAFHLLKQALWNIFSGSAIRQLPNSRLETIESLSFSLEQIVFIESGEFDVFAEAQPIAPLRPAEFERGFTQADLSIAGIFAVAHGLNTRPSGVTVYDGTGEEIQPDRITVLNLDTIAVDLASYAPIAGIWRISIVV
jgi:hypothetical protein